MIQGFVTSIDLPAYRVRQFNQAYYQQLIDSFEQLTVWPLELREMLAVETPFMAMNLVLLQESRRGDTVKALFERPDGKQFETVLMRYRDGRNSVCVSCMVGCPVGCTFCATGKLGFIAHLSSREIVDQVLFFARWLKSKTQKVSNVVFMGMGEPLLNLPAVMEAYRVLTDPEKFGLGDRHITISTSGYVPQIKLLLDQGFTGRLAISLHAGTQEKRTELMRVGRVYPLPELFKVLDEYVARTNKRISYEYVMIDNINDSRQDAQKLIKLLKKRLAHVNLIPYNPTGISGMRRSSPERIAAFARVLKAGGIPYTVRVTMGDDIDAACGQLANKIKQKQLN